MKQPGGLWLYRILGLELIVSNVGLIKRRVDTTSLSRQTKNPRGRPRKNRTQQQCDTPIPPLSKSYLEAMDTWNTAKLLGISSSEKDAVISCLRKSKRLLIMDGNPIEIIRWLVHLVSLCV